MYCVHSLPPNANFLLFWREISVEILSLKDESFAPFTVLQNKKKWTTNSSLHQNCKHIFCALKGWETVSITSTAFSIKATKTNKYLLIIYLGTQEWIHIFLTFYFCLVIKYVCCDSSHTHLKHNTGCKNNPNVCWGL